MAEEPNERQDGGGVATSQDTLSITDNRTGENYEVEVTDGTIRAMELRDIKVSEDDFGLMSYDPAFTNTASCRSGITYIDGENGVLEYRGYPIEDLCDKSNYLEVAYLLVYGELPTQEQLDQWAFEITHHTYVHENIKKFAEGFRHDAHPMGMLLGSVGAMSTFYPDAKKIDDEDERHMAAVRLIAKVPTLAAFAYRHILGLPYVYPDNDLSYPGNFLSMMFKMTEVKYEPDPRLERALDVLWILHADHEQNCSTNAVRGIGSSQVDPYSAIAGGVAALYGPLHGGANEQVLRMLERIGSVDNIPDFLQGVKDKEERLMGFGHRVYKNYDPRARIIKDHVDEVFEVGDRVLGGARFGCYAELVVTKVTELVPLPEDWSFEEGAALPVAYSTAYAGLVRYGSLRQGERVLIQAAAGGVGIAATQIAKIVGAEVYGTASAGKHDAIREQGVDHPIDYRTKDVVKEVRRIAGDKRPLDVAFDALGGKSFREDFSLLRAGGRLVCFGASSVQQGERRSRPRAMKALAQMPIFHPLRLMSQSKSVIGLNMLTLWDEHGSLDEYISPLSDWAREGGIHPVVAKAFPLEQGPEAHRFVHEAKNVGKVVLTL
jgi:citrate synthase